MDGILWLLRTGCQWRHLPPSWPHWQAVYYSFTQWKGKGIFEQINAKLNQLDRLAANRQAYPSVLCIDSHGAAGRSVKLSSDIDNYRGTYAHKRVNGPKRTFIVDAQGRLWIADVDAANRADGTLGKQLVSSILWWVGERLEKVFGDQAYNGVFAHELARWSIDRPGDPV